MNGMDVHYPSVRLCLCVCVYVIYLLACISQSNVIPTVDTRCLAVPKRALRVVDAFESSQVDKRRLMNARSTRICLYMCPSRKQREKEQAKSIKAEHPESKHKRPKSAFPPKSRVEKDQAIRAARDRDMEYGGWRLSLFDASCKMGYSEASVVAAVLMPCIL